MHSSLRIANIFEESLASIRNASHRVVPQIADASALMIDCVLSGGKILACGNGGSAADAQHFAAEMLNRFEMDRPPLPAIALTTDTSTMTSIANDFSYREVFSKQIAALGQPGDTLLVITTSGKSENLTRAIETAHDKDMACIALNGKEGGEVSRVLAGRDVDIVVPGTSTARIQEVHGIVIHCFCDLIDRHLLGIDD